MIKIAKDQKYKFEISGMSCASCQRRVEKAISKVSGVIAVNVNLLTNIAYVEGDFNNEDIVKSVSVAGYSAKLLDKKNISLEKKDETNLIKKRLIISIILLLPIMYITMAHNMFNAYILPILDNFYALTIIQFILSTTVLVVNKKFFISGFKSAVKKSPNMDTLIALGSSAGYIVSVCMFIKMCFLDDINYISHIYHNNLYFESSAMILTLITVGKFLEDLSKNKTKSSLKSIMKLKPKKANLLIENEVKVIDSEEIKIGDILLVKEGESFPSDAVIIEGTCSVDYSILTGESVPIDLKVGDDVKEGTINTSGIVKIKVTKTGENTFLGQIINTVINSSNKKANISRIADKVAGVFVPFIIIISFIVFLLHMIINKDFFFAMQRAISVLVISCPCAFGLATPVAIMVSSGVGAKNLILFKDAISIEKLSKVRFIAFDKTKTVTNGKYEVVKIKEINLDSKRLFQIAYSIEAVSNHPLALAIINKAKEEKLDLLKVSNLEVVTSNGISGYIDGEKYYIGSERFIENNIDLSHSDRNLIEKELLNGLSPVLISDNKELLGVILLEDRIKKNANKTVSDIKKLGIEPILITGDNKTIALKIAKDLEITNTYYEVLPLEKSSIISKYKQKGLTLMIGDGINDATALIEADIGVSISDGSDIAIDSSDIVLLGNNIYDLVNAINLSKKTLRIIYENLFWAFIYNIVCIPLAGGLFGLNFSPMIASIAMGLSSFSVCMNSLRINRFRSKNMV